jgi:hypothetical protein
MKGIAKKKKDKSLLKNSFFFYLLGIDLSNYALEDLLSFDDIFLDYFNNFLKNPVREIKINYLILS